MNSRLPLIIALAIPLAALPEMGHCNDEMLPSGRTFTELRPGERNPFGQAISPQAPAIIAETESEEARLRRIMAGVKVAGTSTSGSRQGVLLGSLILYEGDTLPKLIRNQNETLLVESITPDRIVVTFVERDQTSEARKILIPVGIKPRVDQFLFGEALEKLNLAGQGVQSEELPSPEVDRILKGSSDAGLQNLSERKFQLMGDLTNHENTPDDNP